MRPIVYAALAVGACAGPKPTPELAESTYLADQLACVDRNETRETIDACRAGVRAKWGRDAGR